MNLPKFKMCTKCLQNKPVTRQFFHYENKTPDGFRYWCILCAAYYAKYEHVSTNDIPRLTTAQITAIDAQIKAKRDAAILKARTEHAALHAPYAALRFFVSGVESEFKIKVCGKCQTQKPATLYYFHKSKKTKDRLNTQCKKCVNKKRR